MAHANDPASAVIRRYIVTARGPVSEDEAAQMVAGIGGLRAAAVRIRKRSGRETHLIVELTEGRNREIRRLLEATGHEVTKLMRVAFGGVELGTLAPGSWRALTPFPRSSRIGNPCFAGVSSSCCVPCSSERAGVLPR